MRVLRDLHEGVAGCHLGSAKYLKSRFYWPGHARNIKSWCQTCSACAQRKHLTPKNKAKLQTVYVGYPMLMVAMDILGPFSESETGNLYILAKLQESLTEAYKLARESLTKKQEK